jgi:hypothetical protein
LCQEDWSSFLIKQATLSCVYKSEVYSKNGYNYGLRLHTDLTCVASVTVIIFPLSISLISLSNFVHPLLLIQFNLIVLSCHEIQHNNIQHNDTQHNDIQDNGIICDNVQKRLSA